MRNNQEKTMKVPLSVHRALKQMAAAKGVPMYIALAQLLLTAIDAQKKDLNKTN